jgi:hypothetical protein
LGAAFAVVLLFVTLLPGCSFSQSDTALVKSGRMDGQARTIGEAFDNWANCQSRKWSEFKAPNGVRVVQFDCDVVGVVDFMHKVEVFMVKALGNSIRSQAAVSMAEIQTEALAYEGRELNKQEEARIRALTDEIEKTKERLKKVEAGYNGDYPQYEVTNVTTSFQWTINKDDSFQLSYAGSKWTWKDGKTIEDKGASLLTTDAGNMATVYGNKKLFDPSMLLVLSERHADPVAATALDAFVKQVSLLYARAQVGLNDESTRPQSAVDDAKSQSDADDTRLVRSRVMQGHTRTTAQAFDDWTDCKSRKWSEFKGPRGERVVQFSCEVASISGYMREVQRMMDAGGLTGKFPENEYVNNSLKVTRVIYTFQWTINENDSTSLHSVNRTWMWEDGNVLRGDSDGIGDLSKVVADIYSNKKLFDPSTLVDLAAANNFVSRVLIPAYATAAGSDAGPDPDDYDE